MPGAPSKQRFSRQQGFSLLEAVVAIVLISTTGLALFSWINSSLVSLERVRDANARSEVTQNAVEYMAAVNPMLKPQGNASLGDVELTWDAKQITPIKDGTNFPAGKGLWQFALYDVNVSLAQEKGRAWFSFRLQQLGYKRVRSILFD